MFNHECYKPILHIKVVLWGLRYIYALKHNRIKLFLELNNKACQSQE